MSSYSKYNKAYYEKNKKSISEKRKIQRIAFKEFMDRQKKGR